MNFERTAQDPGCQGPVCLAMPGRRLCGLAIISRIIMNVAAGGLLIRARVGVGAGRGLT